MKKHVTISKSVVLTIVSLILVTTTVSAKQTKTVKVFLLGGQSNMVGQGNTADLKSPYNVPLPKIKIWQAKTKQWISLAPASQFGPELSFGHAMAKAFHNDDIRLVKYARNGTALYNDWAPTTGAQYVAFMKTVKGALADLDANKVKYEIAGMLWVQGESDAHEGKGEDYKKNLLAFIKHMRAQYKTLNMPFIMARVRDFYGKGAQAKMVRDAQESVAQKTKYVTWFDTDDCGQLINGGHYDSAGLIEIGKRFAEKYIELIGKVNKQR